MFTECETCWIQKMADLMVHEVIKQMSGICLVNCPKVDTGSLDTVYGVVEGEYQMQVWLRAD